MCGIAGVIDADQDRALDLVRRLNCEQAHRGPDHRAITRIGRFTIGNTRLAIQDPGPSGNQPFTSPDRRYQCVFNGEIYNFRRLVDHYRLPVRTGCDGEVVPQLWAKLGVDSLAELRGMYAIALVDSLEERLYLARDPFGIKPLHWRALPGGTVLFASEIRPLLRAAPGARISPPAIDRYLRFGAVGPGQSAFDGVTTLSPNSVAVFGPEGGQDVRQILANGPLAASADDADLGTALADSIALHLGADVPTALLLSGGTDSAAIAAVGQRCGHRLECLTIAADGADESPQAARTARRYGHRFTKISAELRDGDLRGFFAAMQQPSIDGLNTYLLSKVVHEAGFKVALSGLGGDEAVGGYSHFRVLRHLPELAFSRRLPAWATGGAARLLARLGAVSEAKAFRLLASDGPRDAFELCALQREVFAPALVTRLTGRQGPPACQPERVPAGLSFRHLVAAEVEIYLQAMLLPDADSFSMASSVELRVPFVDVAVFAAAREQAAATGKTPGKDAIGAALADPYLRWLATRPKRGFNVPMRRWMAGPLAEAISAARRPGSAVWSFIDRAAAQRAGLMPERPAGRWAEDWSIAALNGWLESL